MMKTCWPAILLTFYGFAPCTVYAQSPLVINEILFAPEDSELEFIELYNVSPTSLNLCRYSFSDNRDQVSPICEGTAVVQPGAYVVLARNGDLLSTFFANRPFITPPQWHALNNSGDVVRLYLEDEVIDEVPFEGSWGQRGYSIERIDPAGPSWAEFNWRSSVSPFRATPGEQNSVYAPDRLAPEVLFVEKSPSGNLLVVFNEPVDASVLSEDAFRVQQSRPNALTVLSDSTFRLAFATDFQGDFLVTRGIQDYAANQSPIRSSPISHIPVPGELVINEIMYEPLADEFDTYPDQPEYVELYNTTGTSLSLRRLTLTGPENETGTADSLQSEVPYPAIGPGQFALLYAGDSEDVLLEAFPSMSGAMTPITYMPVVASSLNLLNTGDFIGITVAGRTLDTLEYAPSWHYPDLVATRGIALERRLAEATTGEASNWSSSAHPEGGTPGRVNSIRIESDTPPNDASVLLDPIPFTPDGDGVNDVLRIRIRPATSPQSIQIHIYDSRGRLIHPLVKAAVIGQEAIYIWDGSAASLDEVPTGMYIVYIELQDLLHNRIQKFKKVIVLARS